MSNYVTPFLVLNLGSEMIFVVAQRLQAQNIPHDRAKIVLDDIISMLVSKQLIADLMKPQAVYNHESVRDIIEDVTQCSGMRLDPLSMGKLWDLITMVFKWQADMCEDIIKITTRHLYEIETFVTNPDTQIQLQKVQNIVDNFNKILNDSEKKELSDAVRYWLKDYSVRVSLLLRMGLQSLEGAFIVTNLDPIAEEMLRNIGENIYAVTQNGRILENRLARKRSSESEVNELQLFVDQMLGNRKLSSSSTESGNLLRLTINDPNQNPPPTEHAGANFDNITVNFDDNLNEFGDLNINDNNDNEDNEECLKDELLNMLGSDEV